jgi:hypothetical protein
LEPVEDTLRAEGIPPAGQAVAVLERKVDFAGMGVFQEPGTAGLPFGVEEVDSFMEARVGRICG